MSYRSIFSLSLSSTMYHTNAASKKILWDGYAQSILFLYFILHLCFLLFLVFYSVSCKETSEFKNCHGGGTSAGHAYPDHTGVPPPNDGFLTH